MIVTRPLNNEPDLLTGHDNKDVYLYDLEGKLVLQQNAPKNGWTHNSIEVAVESLTSSNDVLKYGWDAYLGEKSLDNWIGSSEV